ncbi:MAG: DHH family phosphoesterase [Bacilli bacterium]|nr:DHH family phosphoesterase [Bacilli bacterium]
MTRVVTSYINPDLDGIACMYAYSEFLNKTGIKSSYCIIGNAKEEVNIVCDIFNIKLNSKKTIDEEDEIVIVDNHDLNNFKNHDTNKIVEIIDHHTVYNGVTFPSHIKVQIDIIGAAATIVTERFIKENIDISKEAAILLYYGIISNSINLKSSVTDTRDINACKWLESKYSEITKSKIKEIFIKKSQIEDSNLRKVMEIEHTINLLGKNINIGVLEIANVEEFIKSRTKQIDSILNEVKNNYNTDIIFINCIDILNGYNIILCNDKNTEKFLNEFFKFNVQNGIYKTDKIILRKELIRKLIKLDNEYQNR